MSTVAWAPLDTAPGEWVFDRMDGMDRVDEGVDRVDGMDEE